MPSAQDILDAINGADSRLDDVKAKLDTTNSSLNDIKGKLDAINTSVNQVDSDVKNLVNVMQWGFTQVITLLQYADQALFTNDQQNDTIICLLEHISKNTCALLNEAHQQTEYQKAIKYSTKELEGLYEVTHGEAAIVLEREEKLRKQVEECCPPKQEAPPCSYEPCPEPKPLREPPPKTDPPPGQRGGGIR
jgi:ABC-type transporter Mla subunit MlaD